MAKTIPFTYPLNFIRCYIGRRVLADMFEGYKILEELTTTYDGPQVHLFRSATLESIFVPIEDFANLLMGENSFGKEVKN